jgi:hypothetical protein
VDLGLRCVSLISIFKRLEDFTTLLTYDSTILRFYDSTTEQTSRRADEQTSRRSDELMTFTTGRTYDGFDLLLSSREKHCMVELRTGRISPTGIWNGMERHG